MNIKTRILLSVFFLELLGYGLLLFYAHETTKNTLVTIRENQIQATITGNSYRINNLTRLMEHKAIELAEAGEVFYTLKTTTNTSLDATIHKYLVSSFTVFPESIGGGFWFEPFLFDKQQQYYGPYVFWNTQKTVEFTWDLNSPTYDYHHQSWYLVALPSDWPRDKARPKTTYWTPPYWDEAGSKSLMMTVDAFIHNPKGEIIGLSTVDWSLAEMTQFVSSIAITPNSKTFLIDTRSDLILSNSLLQESVMSKRSSVSWLDKLATTHLTNGRIEKTSSIFIGNTFYSIYYTKTDAELLLGIVIPEAELNQEIEQAATEGITKGAVIIGIFILGMMLLLELLFRPFQKVKELIRNSIQVSDRNNLDIQPVNYPSNNEFSPIIDAINLTYNQINHYTKEIEQANKAKTTFLATMSHEIRTPMNAILGYTQVLGLEKDLLAEHSETIKAIDISGRHLLELLNDILDISKIESGAMELYKENIYLFDMLSGISSTFKLRCQQKQLHWHCTLNIKSCQIACTDKAKLAQILINLLGNSLKFTEHGSISFECTLTQGALQVVISDTGAGISKSQQADLFTPFFQGSAGHTHGGTGLGLTIVKKMVDLFHGTITFTSQEYKGTRFELSIPLEENNAGLPKAKHSQDIKILDFSEHQLTALVVDDVKINCDILSKVLLKLGVNSIQAANGVEALEQLKKTTPDILFVDIQMPIMDGFELLERIKHHYPTLLPRTIAISANVYHIDNDYLGKGFQYYITKPFLINEISDTVKDILDKTLPPSSIEN